MSLAAVFVLAAAVSHDWPEQIVRLIEKVLSQWCRPISAWWL